MSKPNYSHTYSTCAYSMKRTAAPWRVTSGCGGRVRIFNGRHYELPNSAICLTCPCYCRDSTLRIANERRDSK